MHDQETNVQRIESISLPEEEFSIDPVPGIGPPPSRFGTSPHPASMHPMVEQLVHARCGTGRG